MSRIPAPVRLVIVVVAAGLFGYLYYTSDRGLHPYGWGVVALISLWTAIWLLMDVLNPFRLVIGEDGRPSTSKLKPFLWTAVVVFSYAVLYAAKLKRGYIEAISEIPPNLLIAIGFDAATLVAAKGITESQVENGQVEKPSPVNSSTTRSSTSSNTSANAGPGAVFQDDKGFPDLVKTQTLVWTVFAIVIYLVTMDAVRNKIMNVPLFTAAGPAFPTGLGLPDIAPALMVLIGLGNAAYLGKKLVTTDTPVLTGVKVESKTEGREITVTGVSLGATQNGSLITINNKEIDEKPSWSNDRVSFKLPDKNPDGGGDWINGQSVRVGLFVKGQTTNQLTFVIGPQLVQISPGNGGPGTIVTLTGTGFGATPADLMIDSSKLDAGSISSWTNDQIKFTIPPKHPSGANWTAAQRISISVIVQGGQSNKLDFTVN